jgi:hypothetical protein
MLFPRWWISTGRYRAQRPDLITASVDDSIEIDRQELDVRMLRAGRVESVQDTLHGQQFAFLQSMPVGRDLRGAVAAYLPADTQGRSVLARLFDELPGAAFLAPGSLFAWSADTDTFVRDYGNIAHLDRVVTGVCISYAAGSAAVTADGKPNHELINRPEAPLALRADDPLAWHALATLQGAQLWRVRYHDVWWERGRISVQMGFQDSAALQHRGDLRAVFHEYKITALIDPEGYVLRELQMTPGSLPYPATCRTAPANALSLIDRPVADFGKLVPLTLPGVRGCTHLNEALKNLQDSAPLAQVLAARLKLTRSPAS